MKPEALVLLLDSPVMQRLAFSWPLVTGPRTMNSKFKLDYDTAVEWAALAGVGVSDVEIWTRALIGHEIIRTDGTVDDAAMALIRHKAIERLPKQMRPKPKEAT